jgi:hypothetical protein
MSAGPAEAKISSSEDKSDVAPGPLLRWSAIHFSNRARSTAMSPTPMLDKRVPTFLSER